MARRFQFSLRRLLGATGLLAIAASCWHITMTSDPVACLAIIPLLYAAIGHLFGRGLQGLIFGSVFVVAVFAGAFVKMRW